MVELYYIMDRQGEYMKKPWFQPLYFNNIDSNTKAVTSSQNRISEMIKFCQEYFGDTLSEKTFIDLGCSVGYFMNEMNQYCKSVLGVEQNFKLIEISKIMFPEISKNIIKQDIFTEILELPSANIYSCLNTINNLRFGNFDVFPNQNKELIMLKNIDEKTEDIFFFQMIQKSQDNQEIVEILLDNTSFEFCKVLMTTDPRIVVDNSFSNDEGEIEENKSKFMNTLFVLYRKEI